MDKGAIERFAITSRVKLRNSVSLRMTELGVNPEHQMKVDVIGSYTVLTDPNNGIERHLMSEEAKARDKLLQVVTDNGFDNVVESVAYTWFNRLIAIRYMEVNNYLPSHIRVLSSITPGKKEPDLVTQCLNVNFNLSSSEREHIAKLQADDRSDDIFRLMFLFQCRELNTVLPELFTRTNPYENLLFDISYTNPEGVIRDLIDNIPEDDFKDAVQIIGWMYQYYNTELKDDTFAQLKKNVKISKERIPSATQLFTPDWIVRYMVENSVGRIWLEGHPDDSLRSRWKYYLDDAEQEPDVQQKLEVIHKERSKMSPEDITVIDPCMGSGHILVYAFDVLMQIYESYGYSKEDAALLIVEKNLYGLDIDDRAYQLAYFAVMMKARQYNRAALSVGLKTNLYSIPDTSNIEESALSNYTTELNNLDKNVAYEDLKYLIGVFKQGKNIGSLLRIKQINFDLINSYLRGRTINLYSNADTHYVLKTLLDVASTISGKYEAVITNPPYMGVSGMNDILLEYVRGEYPDTKSDLSTCFMEQSMFMCTPSGYVSMINIPVWMFLSSYEKLRSFIISEKTIINLVHPGRGIFGSDFGTTSFVISNLHLDKFKTIFCKLYNKQGEVNSITEKEQLFLSGANRYFRDASDFFLIPKCPIGYWASDSILQVFNSFECMSNYGNPVEGIKTGNNEKYLRYWFELDRLNEYLSDQDNEDAKWRKITKGGPYCKWYGNLEYVCLWGKNGHLLKNDKKASVSRSDLFFTPALTWTYLTSGAFSIRYLGNDILYNNKGPACYLKQDDIFYFLGLMNSKVVKYILELIAPTIDCKPGNIANIPVIIQNKEEVSIKSNENWRIMKSYWDISETSWDFKSFINQSCGLLEEEYACLNAMISKWSSQLKWNEEYINKIIIDAYKMGDVLSPEISDEESSIIPISRKQYVIRLISYTVGVMFGRYSLDKEGLCCASVQLDPADYSTFIPDADDIIPINDEEYFGDDIVTYFCAIISKMFGDSNLENNLKFISNSLGIKGSGTPREKIRNYFSNGFIKDHLQMYQKTPIYWLFDSGKSNGFKALIYVHRYYPGLIGKMRKEYLHKVQHFYSDQIRVETDQVRRSILQNKVDELSRYDLAMEIYALKNVEIDLDNGVKHNYALFQNIENSKAVNDKINLLYKI